MDYFFTEEQQETRKLARRIAEEHMRPIRAELDETGEFPWEIVKMLGQAGLFALLIPEEYGGLGGGVMDFCLVTEELSRVCSGVAVSYAASALGASAILQFGSEKQKQKYLPDIADGKKMAAFGLTESTAGSDASAIKTTAEKVPEGYVINGTKQFITNGGDADIYTVIAVTDKSKGPRGASALIVEKDTPGFSFGKKEKKMGIRTSSTRELVFRNCLVPEENLVGREGTGFIMTMKILDKSRPGIGAQALGIAQGAMEAAVDYTSQRIQFGQPLISLPVVQQKIAEMATQIEAARLLVYGAARTIDNGARNYTEEASMSKVFASDVAMKVTTEAVQVCGGAGYMRDYPLEKMMRDAKITQIYEGSNEVLRGTIAVGVRKRKARRD